MNILRFILLSLIGLWGWASINLCAGENIPGRPMSDAMFYGSKLFGILSFLLCYRTGRWLGNKGYLPKLQNGNKTK